MHLLDEPISDEHASPCPATHHRIPELFLIGAAKAATTTLANWLARHPKISYGKVKETNFFSHEAYNRRGFDWYSSLFADVREDQIALDASTGHTRWPQNPGTAGRIHRASPRAKLIYLMRHPVDRAYSHYIHRWTRECHPGEEFTVPFEEYVRTDPMCLDSSDYRAQLAAYLEYFSPDDVLCLFTEDMQSQPQAVVRQAFRFLNLEVDEAILPTCVLEKNQTAEFLESRIKIALTDRVKTLPLLERLLPIVPRSVRERLYTVLRKSPIGGKAAEVFTPIPLRDSVREQMIEYFADSNAWLAKFTERDLSHWNA